MNNMTTKFMIQTSQPNAFSATKKVSEEWIMKMIQTNNLQITLNKRGKVELKSIQ